MVCSYHVPYKVELILWLEVVLCSLFISAMYAGAFVFNRAHFCYCKGPPCTSPVFLLIWFGLLITLISRSGQKREPVFDWTRLKKFLRIRRVVGLIISIERAMTLLRGISMSSSFWCESHQKSEKGFSSLARECWLGKSWKKSFLAFQHQPPEWDESFRPELKQWLH